MQAYQQLVSNFQKIYQLNHAVSILSWDEAVMMPANSGQARSDAIASLKGMEHDILIDKQTAELIEQAKAEQMQLSDWQQRNLQLIEKRYQEANCFDNAFVEAFSQACMRCEQAWRTYREQNDWHSFKPLLKEVVALTRERAQRKASLLSCDPYDALLDEFSPGITQAVIDPLFNKLGDALPNMVEHALSTQPKLTPFEGAFAIDKQQNLAKALMDVLGFDFKRGRLDISHHPFCGGVAEDVRITTRYQESEFISSVMGVCHETGHALYEFGLPKQHRGQPVGTSFGMTVHESQSLFWEMQLCRSQSFMELLSEKLNKTFGNQAAFASSQLYHHYTHVAKGFIRVDADELTYPLHIILRYQLEKKLIDGDCQVDDLPELWDHYMQRFLGLSTLGNDKDGVMQDVHWPSGAFGYFPAYTLGAVMAAQLATSLKQELGENCFENLNQQSLAQVNQWLTQKIHQWGSFYSFDDLLIQATGKPLSAEDYLQHLAQRYWV